MREIHFCLTDDSASTTRFVDCRIAASVPPPCVKSGWVGALDFCAPDGIVKVTIVRRDVTQYDKIVAGFMTQERATPSTKPTVFLCMFRG
jgi:hypothetical protein